MLDEADYLIRESAGMTFEDFVRDQTVRRAFVRSLEIMGEATKKLPPELRSRHPEVDWSGMARMRDRLIHGYFGIDDNLVWVAVRQRVPEIRGQIEAILAASSEESS
jgi:uncharacterized protein with HEPN domain